MKSITISVILIAKFYSKKATNFLQDGINYARAPSDIAVISNEF